MHQSGSLGTRTLCFENTPVFEATTQGRVLPPSTTPSPLSIICTGSAHKRPRSARGKSISPDSKTRLFKRRMAGCGTTRSDAVINVEHRALRAVNQTYCNAQQLYKRSADSLGRPRSELNTGPGYVILRNKSDSSSSKRGDTSEKR